MATIYVKSGATGAADGSSWEDAFTSLTAALSAASAGDDLWVTNNTYNPGGSASDFFNISVKNLTLYGGFLGNEISSDQRLKENYTILDGQSVNEHIMATTYTDHPGNTIIDGFKFIDAIGGTTQINGGALILDYAVASNLGDSHVYIKNCVFDGNISNFHGAAITAYNSASSLNSYPIPIVEDCEFLNNSAPFDGGAIYMDNANENIEVRRCYFYNNSAGRSGGGIYLDNIGVSEGLKVENCIFDSNAAVDNGGGFYGAHVNFLSSSGAYLRNCVFYNNSAVDGGGFWGSSIGSTDSLSNNIFYNNTATNNGNDIWTFSSLPTFDYSSFTDTTSTYVYNATVGAGAVTGNPNFRDPTNKNFRLQPSSNCIDAGNGNNASVTDFEQLGRVNVSGSPTGIGSPNYIDIGAYEYQGTRTIYVNKNSTGINNGTSWTNAYVDITTAAKAAYTNDQIWVSRDIYYPEELIDLDGPSVYGGFIGYEAAIEERNLNKNKTTIDGSSFTSRSIEIDNTPLFEGFIVKNVNNDNGAITVNTGQIEIKNCLFKNNTSSLSDGGAVSLLSDENNVIENCIFFNNQTTNFFSGGALYTKNAGSTIRNSIFYNNTADLVGGAAYNRAVSGSGDVYYHNCIFYKNDPEDVQTDANVDSYFYNCIVYGTPSGPTISGGGGTVTFRNCLVENSGGSSSWDGAYGTDDGGNIDTDPLYWNEDLYDFHLKPNSPCIDAGDGDNASTTDIEGNSRVNTSTATTGRGSPDYTDIGPYEFQLSKKRRFWVNLDSSYTSTNHKGIKSDPYSFNNLLYHTMQDNDVFYLRGSISVTDTIEDNTNAFTYKAWDLNEYGPWRISNTSYISGANFKAYDGILYQDRLIANESERMFFDLTSASSTSTISGNHTNSLFRLNNGLSISSSSATLSRCLVISLTIDKITIPISSTLNISNSILTYADSTAAFDNSGTVNDSNLTYGWTAPSRPSINETDLTLYAMDGGSGPSTVSDTAGVGYEDSWANGLNIFVSFGESTTGNSGYYGSQYIGWDEFISLLGSTSSSLIFHCRGKKTLTANLSAPTKTITLTDWNVSKYGPWRMYGSTSYSVDLSAAALKNGIFEVNYASFKQADRMYVRFLEDSIDATISLGASGSSHIKKSTIISNTDIDITGTGAVLEISDSIIDIEDTGDSFQNDATIEITLDNVITNKSSLSNLFQETLNVSTSDVTYNWASPLYPDWDSSNFSDFILEGVPDASEYGVKNFPTELYFDISASNDSSTYGGSDSSNPGNFYKLFDDAEEWFRVIAYIKGYRDISIESEDDLFFIQEQTPYQENTITSWDKSTNGPWRIRANEVELAGISVADGIIYSLENMRLAGYRVGGYTDVTTYTNMFLNCSGRMTVDSGSTKFQACTSISEGYPIAFYEDKPSNIKLNSYIKEDFSRGTFNGWWSDEFSGPDPNEWTLQEYPPGSDDWVAVQNGSTISRLTPSGVELSGDFDYVIEFVYGENNNDNVSCKLQVRNTTGTVVATIDIVGTNINYINGFGTETYSTTFEPYRSIYFRFVRINGVLYAHYSIDNREDWNAFTNTINFSDDYYLTVEGATRHGIGLLELQSEGTGSSDGFPFLDKDSDVDYIDTVIESEAVEEGSWKYSTIDLQDVVNSVASWSNPGITYSGSNQSSWTTPIWPTWSDAENNNQDAFAYELLASSIAISGSGSFTEYPTGLWGITRTSLGAFYFGTIADFSADKTLVYFSPSTPGNVNFTVSDDSTATSWRWDFGDGSDFYTTDPLFKNPTHGYTAEGVYTVSLTINENPLTKVEKQGYIVSLRTLTLSIVADPQFYYGSIPPGGITVDFGVTNPSRTLDPTAAGSYPGFKWDFDDGFSVLTGLTGPSNTFTSYGTYDIELTVRDIGISGLDSTKQLTAFNVEVNLYNVTINASPTLGKKPLVVNFSVIPATGFTPLSYRWLFRDGSQSSLQNPAHQYVTEGVYDTVLIIDEGFATQQIFSSDASYPGVDVVVPGMQVIVSNVEADFTVAPIHGYLPLTGLFEDKSLGNLTGWQWDFDDGSPQILGETGLYHVYDSASSFSPTLTVYDIYGLTDTTSNQIIVVDDLDIDISDTSPVVSSLVTFSPINDTYATNWQWDLIYIDPILGDITIDRKTTSVLSNRNYEKFLAVPGDYKIKLTIIDDLSNTYSIVKTFTALNNITVVTEPSPAEGESPLLVDFSTTGLDFFSLDSFGWDFDGDGTIDNTTDQTPSYTYNSVGSFSPSFTANWTVTDIDNASISSQVTILKSTTVTIGQQDLVISITADPLRGHKPLTSTFTGNTNNPVSTWKWEVKDTSSEYKDIGFSQKISYTFDKVGIYSVRLTVTDIYGESDVATKTITVVRELSTSDIATFPEQLLEITGSGKIQIYKLGRGVKFSVPSGQENSNPYGFKRSKGSSQIYD